MTIYIHYQCAAVATMLMCDVMLIMCMYTRALFILIWMSLLLLQQCKLLKCQNERIIVHQLSTN